MSTHAEKAARFLALHRGEHPLLLPNPWDAGSAKLFAALGFDALATTSAGFAATKARLDGDVTLDEVLAHSREVAATVDIPVTTDFENGFADAPAEVAANVALAKDTGLAGCSVEDFTRGRDDPIYGLAFAAERVAAAAEAAHAGTVHFVLTARAENYLHGQADLADTIARLQAYQEAGADALYAPGLSALDDIRSVVTSVDRPVNVLALPGAPDVAALASVGVARISVGSAFACVAMGAAIEAAKELQESGTYDFWSTAGIGATAIRSTFTR